MNRATADNQSAQSEEEGLEPTKEWVKDLIDEIVAEEFASPDLELHWLYEDEGDPEKVLEGRLKVGALTLNEMRDALGLDPFDNAAADRPMVLTATGYVPIEANAGGQGAGADAGANGKSASAVQKYSSDQPRVAAGNPDGGQWTTGVGGNGSTDSTNESDQNGTSRPVQYAALETDTRTDATHIPEGVRYAGGPTQIVVDPSALTGISQIDDVTKKLANVLARTIDELGLVLESPQKFGMIVHAAFAANVRLEGIRGIGFSEVEATFALPPGYTKFSIKPDVVLRNDIGDIIAIYDVKTGDAGIYPWREDEFRAATKNSLVPIIELRLCDDLPNCALAIRRRR
jgi:hypothetical protein